ncbi:MAG: hypothetical protein LBI74_10110 [Synergistaceae bacterium]|jgi:hypothetical protein|nr:hypothetical protein [Synergistaceae bacterium]
MNSLMMTKLLFRARFTVDAYLPPFLGNSLRGALGRALVRGNCAYNEPVCEVCPEHCVYGEVFKSRAQVKSLDSVPNPFVIDVPYPAREQHKAGENLNFSITLFGTAIRHREEISAAAGEMFRGRLKCLRLDEAKEEYGREWSDSGSLPFSESLKVELLTPLVLLTGKTPVTEIGFDLFADSLFNRAAGIIDVYGGSEFVLPYALTHRKPKIICENNLRVVKIKQENQPIVGLMGTLRFFGDVTRYLPYVGLCSEIHFGKMTTRGCGKFRYGI